MNSTSKIKNVIYYTLVGLLSGWFFGTCLGALYAYMYVD